MPASASGDSRGTWDSRGRHPTETDVPRTIDRQEYPRWLLLPNSPGALGTRNSACLGPQLLLTPADRSPPGIRQRYRRPLGKRWPDLIGSLRIALRVV